MAKHPKNLIENQFKHSRETRLAKKKFYEKKFNPMDAFLAWTSTKSASRLESINRSSKKTQLFS